ncbi:MAG: hypothetical protein AAGC46_17800 [Solirubrobacteraceae bacterium]|nr:hypothetical protein [Patulibacter sp.]
MVTFGVVAAGVVAAIETTDAEARGAVDRAVDGRWSAGTSALAITRGVANRAARLADTPRSCQPILGIVCGHPDNIL